MLKRSLERMNAYFRRQASSREFTIDPASHVIDSKYSTVKNLLRLTNKTLIGFQRININWFAVLSGMFGLGFGYLAVQVDDGLTGFLGSYKQVVKDGLVSEVLRSEEVKSNLS